MPWLICFLTHQKHWQGRYVFMVRENFCERCNRKR
jgi:hypothetical protein